MRYHLKCILFHFRVEHAEVLEHKKIGNITQSPTYQLIQEEEYKRGKVQEFEPPKERVYDVTSQDIGDRSEIHQSHCLKFLMRDLKGLTDF